MLIFLRRFFFFLTDNSDLILSLIETNWDFVFQVNNSSMVLLLFVIDWDIFMKNIQKLNK